VLFSSAKEGQQCPQFAQVGMDKTASNKVQTNAVTVLLSMFCQHSHLMPTSKFFCPKKPFPIELAGRVCSCLWSCACTTRAWQWGCQPELQKKPNNVSIDLLHMLTQARQECTPTCM